jgi:DNA-binding MurR/RpiR family transcriptional regulator
MEINYLVEAERSIRLEDFDRAVEIMLNGKRLFIASLGPSSPLADLLHIRLRRFGMETILVTDTGRNVYEPLLGLTAQDAILVAAFHHITGELKAILGHASSVGCPSILITDTLGPFFTNQASVILSAMRGPMSTFHSQTIPMVIINALILAVALARPEESLSTLKKLDTLRSQYGS